MGNIGGELLETKRDKKAGDGLLPRYPVRVSVDISVSKVSNIGSAISFVIVYESTETIP